MTEFHLVLTDSAGNEIAKRTLRIADDPEALRAEAYRARRMVEELYRDATYSAGLWEKYSPVRLGDYWHTAPMPGPE